jgi:mannan endo-1,4-beta-mannosidase
MRTLDSMAVGLRALRDAGVVVLWRPFHEMNGDWFWWNGKDTAAFNKAWRHMFDYYSKDKGLDNLLWVYGPNMGGKVTNYYPGPAYVDMVGLDAYTDYIDSNTIKGYSQLVRLGKPFGFSEYGPHGPDNPPGNFDYRKLIAGIRRDFPRTTYFLCWNSRWSLSRNLFTRELLDDPWIANREDLEFTTGVRIARSASSLGRGLRAGRTFLCLGGAVDGGCSIAIGVPTGQSAITALPGPAAGPSSLDVTGRWMPPSDRYRLLPDR